MVDNRIVKDYIVFMNKYDRQKVNIEELSNDFKMSDKQTMILIRDLFEMVKDNNKLIQLNTERITLTYPLILNASKIIILAKGVAKYKILKEIKLGKGDHYPIARIINSDVDTTCILGIN